MCRTPTLVQHKNHLTGEREREREREERKKKRDEEEERKRGERKEREWRRVSNNKVMTKNALMKTYIPQ